MQCTKEYENMCCVCRTKGSGPAPIPQDGGYDQVKQIDQINGLSHSVGTCAMKQGACKLTLNVKKGIIHEALVEVVGCSGMTQSALMAAEILPGRTLLEALNTDLVCDAINVAMREYFLNMAYGRTQTAFSKGGLAVGAAMEDLGAGAKTQVGTGYGTLEKGPRYLEATEGYVTRVGLDEKSRIIGYEYINIGKMMEYIKSGEDANQALERARGTYGRFDEAVRTIDPRKE
ncbi:hypothetical protein [Lactonifactor longoviformis]|uniref:hypothetical protein n=1 Tax=Lactonifactor longoviformis TaxID=341220 RepID=UPI0036F22AA6